MLMLVAPSCKGTGCEGAGRGVSAGWSCGGNGGGNGVELQSQNCGGAPRSSNP